MARPKARRVPQGRSSPYHLEFLQSALEEWGRLDGSVRQVLKGLLEKRLANPRLPGAELHGPLASCYKIKLRKQGYRLVYQVRDEALVVLVIAVNRRDKDKVYADAVTRIQKMIEDSFAPTKKTPKRH